MSLKMTAVIITVACYGNTAVWSEEPFSPDTAKARDVHFAAGPPIDLMCTGPRLSQLSELARQLGCSAFVDCGRGWNDDESRGQPFDNPNLPAFSFKEGTVAQALDAFCKERPFQWHFWKEAGAVWIEPKPEERRAAAYYYQRQFLQPPEPVFDGKNWVIDLITLNEIWGNKLRRPEDGKQKPWVENRAYEFRNSRKVEWWVGFQDRKSPKDILTFFQWWLGVEKGRVVAIKGSSIYLGSTDNGIAKLTVPEIVSTVLKKYDAEDAPRFDRRYDCRYELYRRTRSEGEVLLKVVKEQRVFEKDWALSRQLVKWDPDVYAKYALELFEKVPAEIKTAFIMTGVLPRPQDHKGRFLEVWQKLQKSEDENHRRWADEVIQEYEESKKPEKRE